jgi:uncharacterized metal-binding protein YceD (DUF177 family)
MAVSKAHDGAESPVLSQVIDVRDLPPGGADFLIDADESQRRAIARRLGIPGLSRLSGAVRAIPFKGGVSIRLTLDAIAERQCVASLEPMTDTIRETIDMRFDRAYRDDDLEESDVLVEPLEGDAIDLGELVVQHLSLSLDPYPRKPGAESLLEKYRSAPSPSAFAALKDSAKGED